VFALPSFVGACRFFDPVFVGAVRFFEPTEEEEEEEGGEEEEEGGVDTKVEEGVKVVDDTTAMAAFEVTATTADATCPRPLSPCCAVGSLFSELGTEILTELGVDELSAEEEEEEEEEEED